MKHFGDITKLNGAELPIVDVITGGSPCQDLSVAGLRKGLSGERSGLFMEQIRIVKEMRNESFRQLSMRGADVDIRSIKPRYLVWENVPGALSSGIQKGADFRCVLEEVCRIADKTATVPMPEKGKWSNSGAIMGDGWSVAWRVHDAQFWGVPQRRKRISLVADFGGESAPEILFERKSVSRDFEQSEQEGKATSEDIGTGTNESNSYTLKIRGGCERDSSGRKAGKGALIQTELSGTLGVSQDQTLITGCLNSWDVQSKHIQPENGKAESLYSGECRYGGGESYVMQSISIGNGQIHDAQSPSVEVSKTLNCMDDPMKVLTIENKEPILLESNQNHATIQTNGVSTTLPASMGMGGGYTPMVCYGLDRASFNQGQNAQYDISVQEEIAQTLVAKGPGGGTDETVGTLCAADAKGVGNQYVNDGKLIIQRFE